MKDDRTEIDDLTYQIIFERQLDHNLIQGMSLEIARQDAWEHVNFTFKRRAAAIQCDVQKDYDDQRQGDWTR